MTQDETSIFKNAVLDATEAYLEARLSVADFVKTQIGVVISFVQGQYTLVVPTGNENPSEEGWCVYNKSTHTYSLSTDTYVHNNRNYYSYQNDKKYYHNVSCDNGRVVYNNVLSIGNTAFPEDSVVFLIAPNAQFSNQFILGKLDSTPINIEGGSINIGNGNFIVDSNGIMTAKNASFEGAITGGSIDIGDGNFVVNSNGSMTATSGRIGGFTLDDNYLFALGVVYLRSNDTVTTPSQESYHAVLSSFAPSDLGINAGIMSDFTITFKYRTTQSASRGMTLWLQSYNDLTGWTTVQQENLSISSNDQTLTFNHNFNNNDTTNYRIYLIIYSTTSSTYQQSVRYSIYTNEVVKTALTTDGYNGKINSSSGIIGGIDFSTGRMSSMGSDYNGFEIDNDSIEIRSLDNYSSLLVNNQTYFKFCKSYSWASGAEYPVKGLFVATDSSVVDTTLTLYKDSNNLLNLGSDGYYSYINNGTTYSGYLGSGSDKRIKEDITLLENKISKDLIDNIKTYKFKYKNNDGYHYGVIAQEVRKELDKLNEKDVLLEYGIGDTNIKNQRNVVYQEFIPHLINYVKDLQAQINELKKRG